MLHIVHAFISTSHFHIKHDKHISNYNSYDRFDLFMLYRTYDENKGMNRNNSGSYDDMRYFFNNSETLIATTQLNVTEEEVMLRKTSAVSFSLGNTIL